MTNASCADCGRIIAFRTHDSSEMAECRGCGSWVRRSTEMPGVAVPVRGNGANIPPPRDEAFPSDPRWKRRVFQPGEVDLEGASQKTVLNNPAFQSEEEPGLILGILEELKGAVGRLEENQRAIFQKFEENKREILERIDVLPVAAMPLPDAPVTPVVEEPREPLRVKQPFPTTPFGSPEISLIPQSLEDLRNDGKTFALPSPISDSPLARRQLPGSFNNDFELDDVPGLGDASVANLSASSFAPAAPETSDWASPPPIEPSPFEAAPFEAAPFEASPFQPGAESAPPEEPAFAPDPEPEVPEREGSPFAESSPPEQNEEPPVDPHGPFGAIAPFAEAPPEGEAPDLRRYPSEAESIYTPEPVSPPDQSDQSHRQAGNLLAEEIRVAKKHQRRRGGLRWLVLGVLFLGLAAVLFLLNQRFRFWTPEWLFPTAVTKTTPNFPLFERPDPGDLMLKSDDRFEASERTAKSFLGCENDKEAASYVVEEQIPLLEGFFDKAGPSFSVERLGGWILENGQTARVDFLVREFDQPDRIMPVIKEGQKPWRVDFKSYMEVEELSLYGLVLGGFRHTGQDEIVEEGNVRVWTRLCPEEGAGVEGYTAYCLHDLAERTIAIGAAKSGSKVDKTLKAALASSELRHLGRPALQAILRVKLIIPLEERSKEPARVEIREVLATHW